MIGEYHLALACEFRERLRGCRSTLLGQCQYCARGFCRQHGEQFGAGEEVCRRTACQRKKRDLAAHLIFRAAAIRRNHESGCGEPACEQPFLQNCQRCGAHYCVTHLRLEIVTEQRDGEPLAAMRRTCTHCLARRDLWVAE